MLFRKTSIVIPIILAVVFLSSINVEAPVLHAANVDELKDKIKDRESVIDDLEKEIEEYQGKIDVTQREKRSLTSSINELDLTRDKLLTDIEITNNRIDASNLTIQKLQMEINQTTHDIERGYSDISHIMRVLNEKESETFMEVLLANNELSDFWNDVENLQSFRGVIAENLKELQEFKNELNLKKVENEFEKKDLVNLNSQLDDQKVVVEVNKRDKSYLLSQTKNKESEYQRLLREKEEARDEFLAELSNLEDQLQIAIDVGRLPTEGTAVLRWPLDSVRLTQYFGNTAFAQSGAYNGSGHNGIDMAATVGTPVRSAAPGRIVGLGNTDQYPGCYSYGKWVLVEHDTGLSTLYAHLSLIKVQEGQYMQLGDVLGYSGNTGYSTGPHLHFTVYATQGVRIVRLGDIKKITNCANAYIPIAPHEGYLNPISYLPSL